MDIHIRKLFADEHYFATKAPKNIDIYDDAVIDWVEVHEDTVTVTTIDKCEVEDDGINISLRFKKDKK